MKNSGLYSGRPLDRTERLIVALTIGIGAGLAAFLSFLQTPPLAAKDFTYAWRAGHALRTGLNPYEVILPAGIYPFESQYMYPLTAALPMVPLSLVSVYVAGGLFVGASTGLLVYLLAKHGMGRLWFLVSLPFIMNVGLGQWVPLLMAGALATPLSWALTCKPTLGAALFLYRPSWRTAAVCVAFVLLALAVQPDWPIDWWHAARKVEEHPAPVARALGLVPLLALFRWRRPEARLLAAMALVPQNLYWYDQLPLWLVARTGVQGLGLTALSWISWDVKELICQREFCGPEAELPVLALLYLPATGMVLLDAEGRAAVARWWRTLRGRGGATAVEQPADD